MVKKYHPLTFQPHAVTSGEFRSVYDSLQCDMYTS